MSYYLLYSLHLEHLNFSIASSIDMCESNLRITNSKCLGLGLGMGEEDWARSKTKTRGKVPNKGLRKSPTFARIAQNCFKETLNCSYYLAVDLRRMNCT